MKIVSKQESLDWLKIKLAEDYSWEALKAAYPHCVTYRLPTDTGKKTFIARALMGSIDVTEPGLFWITTWGVWEPCENISIFYGFRKSLGESRLLIDAPGHIFGESDLKDVECLLDLALYFYWDATLFEGAGNIVMKFSHDEWFSVYAKDKAQMQEIKSMLDDSELKQLSKPGHP